MPDRPLDALVVPFRGERYARRHTLTERLAPPYDVLSPAQREMYARRHPHNIVHLTLPAGGDDGYARAAALYRQWQDDGVIQQDKTPSVYIVEQEFTVRTGERFTRTGVIGAVAVEPFTAGRIKPHERTHAGPKEDRLALVRATNATFEALFMLARDDEGKLCRLLEVAKQRRPSVTGELQGDAIRLWRVRGADARALAAEAGRGALYIADGHHRYETAETYRAANANADRLPALVVPLGDPGLMVLPTHRVVVGDAIDWARLVDDLRGRFQIRELRPDAHYIEELAEMKSRGTAALVVGPGGYALALLLKGGASLGDLPFANEPTVAALDVARVDEIIVRRLVDGAGEGARIEYTPDASDVIDRLRTGQASAGVLLNPTAIEQVLAVADAGAAMPQKSTYFVPKVPSGLVIMNYGAGTGGRGSASGA